MAEEFVFKSVYTTLNLHLKKEQKGFRNNQVEIVPAVVACFVNHEFKTFDPEIADLVRNQDAFRRGDVFEIDKEELETVFVKGTALRTGSKNTRGAISTQHIGTEMGVNLREAAAGATRVKEAAVAPDSTCELCGKTFQKDLGGKALRMHMIQHRKAAERASVERATEKPEAPPAEG